MDEINEKKMRENFYKKCEKQKKRAKRFKRVSI